MRFHAEKNSHGIAADDTISIDLCAFAAIGLSYVRYAAVAENVKC